MSFKDIFPRMHGATSIWLSSIILSAPWLGISELIASLMVILAVGSGHRIIFVKKAEIADYAVLGIAGVIILYTALDTPLIFVYSVPFLLSMIFRNDFRKYVIFSSVLTALPSVYIPYPEYHLLFVSFALAYVLIADSLIYEDRRTALLAFLVFVPASLLIEPLLSVFSAALAVPLLKKFKTRTLGLYLLTTLIIFSVTELLIIYHYF